MSEQNGNERNEGASREELENIKRDLEKQRDARIDEIVQQDATIREINGAIKGIFFALNGPPKEELVKEEAE